MLDVILHVPVEKSWQPAAGIRAAAKAKVWCIWAEADMLWRRAEVDEPPTVKRTEVDDDD